jgi:hypothetical protein
MAFSSTHVHLRVPLIGRIACAFSSPLPLTISFQGRKPCTSRTNPSTTGTKIRLVLVGGDGDRETKTSKGKEGEESRRQ